LAGEVKKVCFPYEGEELGGSHISSMGLIRKLDPERYQPIVVLSSLEGAVYKMFQEAGIPVIKSPRSADLPQGKSFSPQHAVKILPTVAPITRFLKKKDVAIVHSNDGRSHAMWALPAKLSGAKLFWHHRSGPQVLGLRFVAPLIADQVASVSEFSSPKPGIYSAARKNQVIHSPFDISVAEDRNASRAILVDELEVDPDTKLVGYFGTFTSMKRPTGFVDAIAALAKADRDMPVLGLMFGPPEDPRIGIVKEHAEKTGVANSIKFMGFRSPGSRWLAGCDLLMIAAVEEPFGRTLVEAMLVGTPVVATDAGGNPEAIRHEETGLLAPPENPEALAFVARRVLQDADLREKIVQNARRDALNRFGEKRHAQTIMALYDKLLAA